MRDVSQPLSLDLDAIHEAYHAKVVACATRFLGRTDAEDIAQEVFIKIARSLGTLEAPAKLSAWIYAITLNTIRDVARKRRVTPVSIGSAPADPGAEHTPLDVPDTHSLLPDEAVERAEMIACYLGYVSALPPAYAEVYVLSEFDGLSDDAIASRLSVSRGAVKIRLHRARTRLLEALRRDCQCYRDRQGHLMGQPKPQ